LKGKSKPYSLLIHPEEMMVCGEDKIVKFWSLAAGHKEMRQISTEGKDTPASTHNINTKLAVNPTGHFLAVANLDKRVRVYNFHSGKCYFEFAVGETVTGLHFTPDSKRLVFGTADGCIFVYRMTDRVIEVAVPKAADVTPVKPPPTAPDDVSLDIHELIPDWAKSKYPDAIEQSPNEETKRATSPLEEIESVSSEDEVKIKPSETRREFTLSISKGPQTP
jgi:WD40 repeat protein